MKFAVLLALAIAAPVAARETIGIYKGWGAFRDASPARCYAIARPVMAGGRASGFASVATWPKRGLRASLYVRLSRERDRSAGVTLTVGERRFALWRTAWMCGLVMRRAIGRSWRRCGRGGV